MAKGGTKMKGGSLLVVGLVGLALLLLAFKKAPVLPPGQPVYENLSVAVEVLE